MRDSLISVHEESGRLHIELFFVYTELSLIYNYA